MIIYTLALIVNSVTSMATSSLETVTEQSPQAILDKLDDLLKDCTPLEIEDAPHGEDYTTGLDKLKKVAI